MDTTVNALEEASSESEYSDSYEGESNSESAAAATTSSGEDDDENGEGEEDDEDYSPPEDAVEMARITKDTLLHLPKGLCENAAVFQEFFSIDTWRMLPANYQAYLKNKFLPHFPENNEKEQEKCLEMLFSNELIRFHTSPLVDLQRNLEEGNYRPDVLRLRESIAKSRRRERRFQEYERISQMAKNMLVSRERLLRLSYEAPPGALPRVEKVLKKTPQLDKGVCAVRARKRFYFEIGFLRSQVGIADLSEDDLEDEPLPESNDDKEPRVKMEADQAKEAKILGTLHRYKKFNKLGPVEVLCDKNFKNVLFEHKCRKLEEPDRPEFETNDIRLRDVYARTQMTGSYKRVFASGKTPGRKPKAKLLQEKLEEASTEIKTEVKEEIHPITPPLSPPVLQPPQISNTIDRINQHHSIPMSPQPLVEQHTVEQQMADDSEEDEVVNVETIETTPICHLPNMNGSEFVHSQELIIPMAEIKTEDLSESAISSPPKHTSYHGKIKIATFSDLKGIDVMNIPMDMDDSCLSEADFNSHHEPIAPQVQQAVNSIKSLVSTSSPELMQETHACFLSLIRDIFCSTPNHRMKLDDLREKINVWLSNPITALNDWYCLAENWSSLVTSAINFLAGDFSDQPDEYVPYIEYKSQLNIYQWIGASRDSDSHLVQLCNYWMSRKHEMTHKPIQKADMTPRKSIDYDENGSCERAASPPLPRCPTAWAVQPSSSEEMLEFQRQERERFENPHRSFTYRMHGYESVVGPVKGIYTQIFALTKARGHSMMIGDRPSFVTILTLVRDATARLPNGEGTRADISELLKCSQYINRDAPENVLQTIVSGALDRMHTENDPCVRYDTKRKIWIYLHRNRSEEEFERMHQQYQGVGKHKKPANRKVKAKILVKENVSISSPPAPSSSLPALMPSNPIIVSSSSNTQKNNLPQNPKPVLKPEMISEDKIEIPETQEIYSPEDALSPGKSPLVQQQQQQPQQQQHTQLNSQNYVTNNTPTQQQSKKQNAGPIVVATPAVQNVHVSSANNPTVITIPGKSTNSSSPEKTQPITSPTIVFPTTQQIITASQQPQQQQISMANKKISLNKPIIINQSVASGQQQIKPQQQQQQHQQQTHQQQQSFIIPININNSEQFKVMGNSILLTDQQKPKISPTSPSTFVQQQSPKSVVRLAGGKSLLSPQLNKIQSQSIQKLPTITATAIRPQLQKTIGGISLINNATVGGVKMSSQTLTNLQQKQIIQSFLSQQGNKQRLVIGNLGTVIPQQQQQQVLQNKNVIIQQQTSQPQNQINAATSVVASTATNSGTGTIISTSAQGGNIISSPIFQIHSAPATPGGTAKIQTISASSLTPQQQQNLLQNLKQPQFKSVQGCQLVPTQQQSLIIKQQPIFSTQQPQQQLSASQQQKILNTSQQQISTGTMTAVSVGSASPKAVVVSNVGNIITSAPSNITQNIMKHPTLQLQQNLAKPITVVSQPQNITRFIKSGNVQSQIISRGLRTQSMNPVMAKVLTNTTGQIISLESLLQKQGATLRVTNAKPTHNTNLIQLTGTTGSQITQYAVVSQGRNLISVGGQQTARLISTQASSSTVSTTTTPASKPVVSAAPNKLISTNQITAQQLVNAKILSKTSNVTTTSAGGIRMINAQNFNIANIQGKQVLFASKQPTTNLNQQQMGHQHSTGAGTSVVIGGQTLKLQGNVISTSNVQLINKMVSSVASSTATTSTVMMGNQILKVQQPTPIKQGSGAASSTPLTTIASTNTSTVVVNNNSVLNHQNMATKTVVLGSTGQTIRVQTPNQMQAVNIGGAVAGIKNVTPTSIAQGSSMKSNANRVVLAVQGGGQIFLSPNFQGGAINLKSLQGMKVVSLAQQPQIQQQPSQQIQQQTQTTTQQQHQQQQQTQGKSKNPPK